MDDGIPTRANTDARTEIVRAACPHDCPDTCAMHVTVQTNHGRREAIRIHGDPDHPPTAGTLCAKVSRYLERTYHPQRILQPMRRTGPKGRGDFEPVTWDHALGEIARRLRAVADVDAQRIVPYSYAGTMGMVQGESMALRFFNRLGASRLDRTICSSAGGEALTSIYGKKTGTDFEQFENSRLIIFWGANPITSNLHLWRRALDARRRGAKLVAIDPYGSDTALKCDQHVALLPGTDAALALGLAHVMIREGWIDRDFIDRHALGFDELASRAADYPPQRVASICGITADVVQTLARDYAHTRPCAIRLNYGMQRTRGGGNAVRAVACLPVLAGHWRDAAGGMLLSASGEFDVDESALYRPDLLAGRTPRTINMTTIGNDLLSADPPIEALVVYNSNPVAVAPDSARVVRGFEREDLFTVVLEHFRTDTADYADFILPATTQLEHVDVHKSYGHFYLVANNPAIEPLGEALPNTEIFRRLAAAMGFDEPCFRDTDDQLAAVAFRRRGTTAHYDWDRLKRKGWERLELPSDYAPFADGAFPTASGRCEFHSEALAALGSPAVPDYVPPYESVASNASLAARFPLAMISPPARNFLNSTFVNVASLRGIEGEPTLQIHPSDAAPRGLQDGARARVYNDRGALDLKVHVTDRARPGVVVALSVWWRKLAHDRRNANELTSQRLTDIGRAPTFYDCLVEVERA